MALAAEMKPVPILAEREKRKAQVRDGQHGSDQDRLHQCGFVGAGAGVFQAAYVTLTPGVALAGEELSPEGIAAHWSEITDRTGEIVPDSGAGQSMMIGKKLQDG